MTERMMGTKPPPLPPRPADQSTASVSEKKPRRLDDIVTTDYLKILSSASGGFSFYPDPALAREFFETGTLKAGHTVIATKVIHYNPLLVEGLHISATPENGLKEDFHIEPWTDSQGKGFSTHEVGHFTPWVLVLDHKMMEDMAADPDIVPEAFRGSPDIQQRVLRSIQGNLINGELDIWLESYMGRRPYFPVREDIDAMNHSLMKGGVGDHTHLTKPEQLVQILLKGRYANGGEGFTPENIIGLVDPDVSESYQRVIKRGGMRALMDRRDFENFFATPAQFDMSIERKFEAHRQLFLPEYLQLMEAEAKERKEERQKPLTPQEEKDLIEQLVKELEKAAAKHHLGAPSEEEEQFERDIFDKIQKALEARRDIDGKPIPMPLPQRPDKRGMDRLKELADQLQREQDEARRRGLADSMQVKPESVLDWERIKQKYQHEIQATAAHFAEIFLEDRRKRIEYMKREGPVTPGLEFEDITARASGELDPDTKMQLIQNLEFLETEVEFIVDTSGSMAGERLRAIVDLMVVLVEAWKIVKQDLEDEQLTVGDEEPLRIGATKFAASPKRITKLEDPLNDHKEIQIVDQCLYGGGGTDETGAITVVYQGMKLGKPNVIKIIAVFTDGDGNREGLHPIIQQVEEDDLVIFLVVGIDNDIAVAQAIADSYLAPLRKGKGQTNVFAIAADTLTMVMPGVLEFLKEQVEKRRDWN